MRLRNLLTSIVLAGVAFAADVAGTWQGDFHTREGGTLPMVVVLKTSGDAVTGTIQTGDSKPMDIEQGKATANEVSFSLVYASGANSRKVNYTGHLDSDELKLTSQVEGASRKQEVTLHRK